MDDTVIPLASAADFTSGAFADLVNDYPPDALTGVLAEGTRIVEDICDRRLAPFTVTETSRAQGIDPDEYAGATSMPLSIQGTLGASYASQLGVQNLVRHTWLRQYPPRYQDMWLFPQTITVQVFRSYGGVQNMTPSQILEGPDDHGHVWFQLGQFIPAGSRIQVTYSGGYSPVPASLARAAKYVSAAIIVRELNPDDTAHNPDQLMAAAEKLLREGNWIRV